MTMRYGLIKFEGIGILRHNGCLELPQEILVSLNSWKLRFLYFSFSHGNILQFQKYKFIFFYFKQK